MARRGQGNSRGLDGDDPYEAGARGARDPFGPGEPFGPRGPVEGQRFRDERFRDERFRDERYQDERYQDRPSRDQGFEHPGFEPPGRAGQGFAAQGFAAQGFAGQGFAGQGFAGWSGADDPAAAETTQPLPAVPADGGRPGRPGRSRGPGRRRLRRFAYRATLTIATLLACLALAFGLLLADTPSAGQATQIAARLAAERGIAYPGPPPPASFVRPLVATEDHRFYTDIGGLDLLALAHSAAASVTGRSVRAGATIDLQLAKLLYIGDNSPRHDTWKGNLTQAALAVKLDAMYTKPEILQMYAEVAYYGHGYYGLEAASCGYFGHPAAKLTVTQGAMLAGVVNAPDFDDPADHPQQAHARLAHVIGRMVAVGQLTPAQGAAALSAPLGLTPGHSPAC
ncbi:MAG TPA: biosynthetic peptidoglycan transglycosylase [Trebonia sp.]|nr:biosynthetic peptidoglycan transglycosylase [Trebonia sp.]